MYTCNIKLHTVMFMQAAKRDHQSQQLLQQMVRMKYLTQVYNKRPLASCIYIVETCSSLFNE